MNVSTTIRDISELTLTAQKACRLFLQECEKRGLKVLITETYRSQERQNYLYEQGRTRPGNKVTWTKNSRHTSRRAWDICQNIKGREYSDKAFFKACGEVARELDITWGGTWKTPDTPHFEIATNWTEPKEDIDMEELRKLQQEVAELKNVIKNLTEAIDRTADRVTKFENPMIYNHIDKNMPDWAKEGVQYCLDNGIIKGTSDGLGLDDKDLKYCTMIMRMMKDDKK